MQFRYHLKCLSRGRKWAVGGPLAALLVAASMPAGGSAHAASPATVPLKERHLGATRGSATRLPRSEGDQAVVDGWPLYRTERGQRAFNDTMATLRASDGKPPAPNAFRACPELVCDAVLPEVGAGGWIPPGRIWVSPDSYVLFAQSPRSQDGRYRRRGFRSMRYFVFHEFHNSSRNTDPYDTISSHSGSVFVPFYMSKQGIDAAGHRYVAVIQIAPYDVVSVHATNRGSAGPGVEVAKNAADEAQPLQNVAGILLATIVKSAAPHLQVVNHRGSEGLPMLRAYEARLRDVRGLSKAARVTLPFIAATAQRIASASGALNDVISRPGLSPRIRVAERAFVEQKATTTRRRDQRRPALPVAMRPDGAAPVLIAPIRPATRPPASFANGPSVPAPVPVLVGPIRPAVRPEPAERG